ncbi:MAG TPA: hypothetical protein VFA56_05205 [Gaiellaceae bacterium]|nr:hypothetical protein [Gaiellaceae bacterium]
MRRTPSQTVGPFYSIGLCRRDAAELDPAGLELSGRLLDGRGEAVVDGMIEVFDAESRRWGRAATDGDGRFRFRVPASARRLEALVFARGLLRHELTRIYLDDVGGAEDETLVAARDGEGYRFDIRLQGAGATRFFEH